MSQDKSPIVGHVAQVVTERELIINIGSKGGVKKGMRFAVLAKEPIEVRDPITHVLLDNWDQEKVNVEAVVVRENVTVCRTYEYTETGMRWGSLSILDQIGPIRREYETLNANSEAFPPRLSEEESYIKIGDRVREIIKTSTEREVR